MEEVAKRLTDALLKVASNKGAPGPDGQTIEALCEQWPVVLPRLQADLLAGTYQPGVIRRVYIPKAGGGQRGLGIPTVTSYRKVVQRVFGFVGGHASVSSACSASGLRFCMCVVSPTVACMCATAAGGRNVSLDEEATDRGPEPAERPLTFEVLVELVAVVAAIGGGKEGRELVSESRTG